MSILFVHGVNNRKEDAGYLQWYSLRKQMFEREVITSLRSDKYPNFSLEDDVYWGDKGATFAWNLKSIPSSSLESLGLEQTSPTMTLATHAELIYLLAKTNPLNQLLVQASKGDLQNVSEVVAAIFNQENAQLSIIDTMHRQASDQKAAEKSGVYLSLFFQAVDRILGDQSFLTELQSKKTDGDFLTVLTNRLFTEVTRLDVKAEKKRVEQLGFKDDLVEWAKHTAESISSSVQGVLRGLKDDTINKSLRASSLVLLQNHREAITRSALLFFGDVFVYLHRGREDNGSISAVVAKALTDAYETSSKNKEAFVVITHSFGSMILYDLLTSDRLSKVKIDLWVSAGAQVSLFAEMRLFAASPPIKDQTYGSSPIGKPKGVERWINFYDASDTLSYLMQPVFGDAAVRDIPFKHNANLRTAHGDYFAQPAFYKEVLKEIRNIPD
jgi:hypothetical protein